MLSAFRIVVVAALVIFAAPAQPCSRILWNDNGYGTLVGRNMDWSDDMGTNLWLLPRGVKRDGLAPQNPLSWTSKYGSVAITAYDMATADGMNEKGLVVHMLYLASMQPGPRDAARPGLSVSMWTQYYLDNFPTVAAAVAAWETVPYQLLDANEPSGGRITVHLAMEDASGDSAILEVVDGKMKIYHDRRYTVMTNEPTYDKQLQLLAQHDFKGGKSLPGSYDASDRFIRGAYYAAHLPRPKNQREAVAYLMAAMRNVAGPFINDPERADESTTIWRTVTDPGKGLLYFDSVVSPQVFWIDFSRLSFEGSEVRKITVVGNYDLHGDVSGKFQKAPMFAFLKPNP
jgi:penicillin V acylase-like amidase (Ntn superfamily)